MELYFKFKFFVELISLVVAFPLMLYWCFEWLKLRKKINNRRKSDEQK